MTEDDVEHATAPALSSGSLPLPHLGDCTHDGQPLSHSQAGDGARVACSQPRSTAKPALGEAGTAGVAVVDEDRRRPVSGCSAVETPPRSHRSQVASSGSMPIAACSAACSGARQLDLVEPGALERVPASSVNQTARVRSWRAGQVQRELVEHLAGAQPAPLVGRPPGWSRRPSPDVTP